MKRICYVMFITVLLSAFISCADNNEKKAPSTALDTGREFIRASLDGNFETAESFLLRDTQNVQLFETYKKYYNRLPDEKKVSYRNASYTINKYEDLADSVTVINYSNSYMNKPLEIKMVRVDKRWTVDFKYTYSGNLPIN